MKPKYLHAAIVALSLLVVGAAPALATKHIPGDPDIGKWDDVNRIYTLATDVSGTIQIDEDHLTLDGAGCTVYGTGTGYGVDISNRTLFLGTKGAILGGGWSRSPRIIPEAKMRAYRKPPKTLPRVKGHHRNWLDACRGKRQASTHFGYSGPLTEFTLMGNVAIRAGKRLDFDWKNMKITNVPDANRFIKPRYREGRTI